MSGRVASHAGQSLMWLQMRKSAPSGPADLDQVTNRSAHPCLCPPVLLLFFPSVIAKHTNIVGNVGSKTQVPELKLLRSNHRLCISFRFDLPRKINGAFFVAGTEHLMFQCSRRVSPSVSPSLFSPCPDISVTTSLLKISWPYRSRG